MTPSQIKIAVKNLEAYPPRLGEFPHSPQAEALMDQSLKAHGAFPKFIGRPHPTQVGKFQIPFGALTLNRITKLFGADYEVSVEIAERTNDQMFALFEIENSELWHNVPLSYLEVVAAVIAAHKSGDIKIPLRRKGEMEANDIARYLGWIKPSSQASERIYWCLHGLELMTSGDLKSDDLIGLNSKQAHELIAELMRRKRQREKDALYAEKLAAEAKVAAERASDESARRTAQTRQKFQQEQAERHRQISKTESRKIVTEIGEQLRKHKLAATEVRRKSEEIAPPITMPESRRPWIFQLAKRLAAQIDHILAWDDERAEKIREIVKYREKLDPLSAEILGNALHALAQRATDLASALGQAPARETTDANPRKLKGNSK